MGTWTQRAEIAVLTAVLVTLALAVTLPVYMDEVNWQMLRGRLLPDGGRTIRFNYPSCAAPFSAPPPWYFYPFRLVHSLVYWDLGSPLRLRLTGIASTVAVGAFVGALLLRLPQAPSARRMAALMAAIGTLGVLPMLLSVDRPEPLLVAGVATLLVVPLLAAGRAAWAGPAIAILACSVAMFSWHPKALFFLPLMLAAGWSLAAPRVLRLVLCLAIIAGALGGYGDWSYRMACRDDPYLDDILGQHSVSPALAASPFAFIAEVWRNQTGQFHLLSYASSILFRQSHQSHWLPPGMWPPVLAPAANVLVMLVLLGLALAIVASLGRMAARAWHARALDRETLLLLGFAASVATLNVFQKIKNVFEASLVIPLLGLGAYLAVRNAPASWQGGLRRAGTAMLLVSLLSQATLWLGVVPLATGPWVQGGYLPDQPQSIAAIGNAPLLSRARSAAELCAIPQPPRHLVIDALTYPAFSDTREPILLAYVTGGWGKGIVDLPGFLARLGSSGLVAGCEGLPPALRGLAREQDGMCCIGPFGP